MLPFSIPKLPPPNSATEALEAALQILAENGLSDATVSLTPGPGGSGTLAGARLHAKFPHRSLERMVQKKIAEQVAAHGMSASETSLSLANAEESGAALRLTCSLHTQVKAFGGTLPMRLQADLDFGDGRRLQLREPLVDVGSGIFSNIAAAMIRPTLQTLASNPILFEQITQTPVQITRLFAGTDALEVELLFLES